jgi:hypothetical protein
MNPFAYQEYKDNLKLEKFYDSGDKNKVSNINNMGDEIMELKPEIKEKGQMPDFKGDGIAVWVKKDKNGKEYLSCSILGNINIPAWKYEPKPK